MNLVVQLEEETVIVLAGPRQINDQLRSRRMVTPQSQYLVENPIGKLSSITGIQAILQP